MPKGVKGFQKGHIVSASTRGKISEALKRSIRVECDYCRCVFETKPSAYKRANRVHENPELMEEK